MKDFKFVTLIALLVVMTSCKTAHVLSFNDPTNQLQVNINTKAMKIGASVGPMAIYTYSYSITNLSNKKAFTGGLNDGKVAYINMYFTLNDGTKTQYSVIVLNSIRVDPGMTSSEQQMGVTIPGDKHIKSIIDAKVEYRKFNNN